MPDLPSVSQEFTADNAPFIAALQEMIDQCERLAASVQDDIDKIAELAAALEALPDVKNIEINITGDAIEEIGTILLALDDLPDEKTIFISVVYKTVGEEPEAVLTATEIVRQVVIGTGNEDLENGIQDILVQVTGNAVEQIEEIRLALGELPDEKVIDVSVIYKNAGAPGEEGGTIDENVVFDTEAMDQAAEDLERVASELENVAGEAEAGNDELAKFTDALVKLLETVAALTDIISAIGEVTGSLHEMGEVADETAADMKEMGQEAEAAGDEIAQMGDQLARADAAAAETSESVREVNEVAGDMSTEQVREAADSFTEMSAQADDASVSVDKAGVSIRDANASADLLAAADKTLADAMNDDNLSAAQLALVLERVTSAKREARLESANLAVQEAADAAAAAAESDAMSALADDLQFNVSGDRAYLAALNALSDGQKAAAQTASDLREAEGYAVTSTYAIAGAEAVAADDTDKFNQVMDDATAYVALFKDSEDSAGLATLNMATAAKQAGSSVGAMMIPLGAAAFGITGTATAVHLVVMGVFEFLAVFVPAMYAAAAATAVLLQGATYVYTGLKSVYEVGESLGPMFGETQGDMIGLGHSLQVAQNAADPAAYQLLGEAIIGVNEATGNLNNQMGDVTHSASGAGQQISSFGQLGLAVTGELTKFGAEVDSGLTSNFGQVTEVLSKAGADLVEFGEILGNIGHSILNLAADMPGLAEIVLKLFDGFTYLLKAVTSLPPTLIAVVMGIEEAYRWSGLLAGTMGLLGRAIGLVGTLGIPVFVKIGANMGTMVASVINGVSAMIVNFAALGMKAGVMGEGVDSAVDGIVEKLAGAADFMTGPWGIALTLAAAGVAALVLWLGHTQDATEQFISSTQKAVAAANSLTVLDTIAQQMTNNQQHLAAAYQQANQALQSSTLQGYSNDAETATSAAGKLTIAQGSLGTVSGQAAVEYHELNTAVGENEAYANATQNIQQLTANQQHLFEQSMTTVTGAESISKAYGVDFSTALGIADLAGVNLGTTQVKLGDDANTAGIKIEGLIQGYQALGQSGNTLANSMNAVNIEAGIQGSQITKVNQAWDAFINMSTSLTSSFAGFNDDLQQMGNVTTTAGTKIQAFSGSTQLSVGQIATALKSFSGNSAQVWQSFDQSISSAETFTDNLRTAAAAGVVTSQQYTQGIASIVAQLEPYGKASGAALSQVMALAQEAGGPAYNASASLATNYENLKNWTDKNALSTNNFTGYIDTLTEKLSNVTTVAQNFASTLQQDVLNAIAAAGANTKTVTGLVQAYTTALTDNGTQSAVTKAAQNALTSELEKYSFSAQDASQIESELSQVYGTNGSALDDNTGKLGDNSSALDVVKTKAGDLTVSLNSQLSPAQQAATLKGSNATTQMEAENIKAGILAGEVGNTLTPALKNIPKSVNTNITATASGQGGISTTMSGASIIAHASEELLFHSAAAGGVIPGYDPGNDTVPVMLSRGEGVLVPQAVRALGGENAINSLNRHFQHMAGGGIAGDYPNPATVSNFAVTTADAFLSSVETSFGKDIIAQYQREIAAAEAMDQGPNGKGPPVSGNVVSWLTTALQDTGGPMSWLPALEWLTNAESSGNPYAVDPILVMGEHAEGLLQTLPSTYAEFATVPGGIFNPISNAVAAIRYIMSQYGSPLNIPGIFVKDNGYDAGGWLQPGLTLARNNTGQPERVLGPNETAGDGGMMHTEVHIDGRKVFEAVQPYVLQYNSRNSGNANVNGTWRPR